MMREYDFRVAGFLFKLHLPEEQDIDRLLPSFRPFRCVTDIQGRAIFNFVAVSSSLSEKGIIRVLEETESDLGHIRLLEMAEGYRVELRYTAGSPVHVLHAEPFFTLAMIHYLHLIKYFIIREVFTKKSRCFLYFIVYNCQTLITCVIIAKNSTIFTFSVLIIKFL